MPSDFTYKPSIFIASSGKSKPLAAAPKRNLIPDADVDVWAEDIFKLNEGTLDTLLNRCMYYDFFIAIFSADDTMAVGNVDKRLANAHEGLQTGDR